MVVVADTHRAEQPTILRVSGDVEADSLPEQHEWRMAALILMAHEGPAELDRVVQ